MNKGAAVAVVLAPLLVSLTTGCGSAQPGGNAPVSVDAVIKALDNPFFVSIRDGITDAAHSRKVNLSLAAAPGVQDTAGQASILESFVGNRAACYIVNPIDGANLITPLSHLPPRTPIVNVDNPLSSTQAAAVGVKITTFIATNDRAAGRLAADAMARFVPRGARVAVIGGLSGPASDERVAGFTQDVRGRFRVVATVSADYDRLKATLAAAALLHSDHRIRGFFAANDLMALGAVDALRAAGRAGQVAVVGVDGIRESLSAIRAGAMSATVSQYPYTMGQLAVQACIAAARGQSVPARIEAPVLVIGRDNVAAAERDFPRPLAPPKSPFP
jgi:ABC-type sugar transport system substrate-binding protein